MELFTINRYAAESIEHSKANENEILEKLLKKVEKRKRRIKESAVTDSDTKQVQQKLNVDSLQLATAETEDLVSNDIGATTSAQLPEDVDPTHVDARGADAAGGFEVIGEDTGFAKRQKVDMVLPPWLAHPTVISTSIAPETENVATDSITNLPYLITSVRQALKELNITRLFPVQTAVIPWILKAHTKPGPFRPRDICVSAPTGSGKTLTFAIPVVQLLVGRVERKIRALIVLPVAELALQVYKVFKKLCEKTDLNVCLLSKQLPFPLEQEKLVECYKGKYYSKVDLVVTTPGRLVDHLHATKGFCLKALKLLVIDEADRIMDAVFQNWLYHLDAHVRSTSDQLLSGRAAPLCYNELLQTSETQPHKLLFSATLSQDPEKLQSLRLFQPKLFTSVLTNSQKLKEKYANATELEQQQQKQAGAEARGEFIGKYTTPAELTEKYCLTESRLKPLTLYSLINEHVWQKFLCFTNSTDSASRLGFVLQQMFEDSEVVIHELTAAISAKERANVLSQFARGKINGLICSDALARGIDIPDVDIVVSYDPPRHVKTYIHRIGRTARAGRRGNAVTLLTQKELHSFNDTLAEVGKVITEEITVSSTFEEQHAKTYSSALSALRQKLEKDKRTKVLQRERAKSHTMLHKDPAKMTIMEKLQAQANAAVLQKASEQKQTQPLADKKAAKQAKAPKQKNNAKWKHNKNKEQKIQ